MRKLKSRATALPGSAADEIGYVLDAHLAMLANSRLIRGVNQRITRQRINAERAIQIEIEEIAKSFAAMSDPYLAARIDDIRVVGSRLIRNLLRRPYVAYSGLSGGAIILAEEVTPADTALMDPRRIGGFAAEFGGPESHTAIMARALGLPAVLAVTGLMGRTRRDAEVVIDGTAGIVIIDPVARHAGRVSGAPRGRYPRTAPVRADAPSAGDHEATASRSGLRPISNCRSNSITRWPTARPDSAWYAPNSST